MNPNGAIIVQSNLEIMVEVDNPNYTTARDAIAPFTELVKSPEHLHTYKISHLSLWNAAATGLRGPRKTREPEPLPHSADGRHGNRRLHGSLRLASSQKRRRTLDDGI